MGVQLMGVDSELRSSRPHINDQGRLASTARAGAPPQLCALKSTEVRLGARKLRTLVARLGREGEYNLTGDDGVRDARLQEFGGRDV
jgi:hypothetical protein